LPVVPVKSKSKKVQVEPVQGASNHLFRGGGRVFGPRPRNYGFKLNKKVKQLARKSALAYKVKENGIIVLEAFDFNAPKTQEFVTIQNNLKINDKKSLFVLPELNKNIYLSSRNLQGVKVVVASELTTYDILNASSVVILEGSLEQIEGGFNN
jgi:large subunit ribosomal protein L4